MKRPLLIVEEGPEKTAAYLALSFLVYFALVVSTVVF